VRSFAWRTELVNATGHHIRYIPSALSRAMVNAGAAEIHNANGKVKSIRLVTAAASHAQRIGKPTGMWLAPRFCVRKKTGWRRGVAASSAMLGQRVVSDIEEHSIGGARPSRTEKPSERT
jgi:hypothetical protein